MTSRILGLNWSLGVKIIFSKQNSNLMNYKCPEGDIGPGVFRTTLTANPGSK